MIARIGPVRQRLAREPVPHGPVTLTVEVRTDRPVSPTGQDVPGLRVGGPDTIGLSVEGVRLAELDGRYLSTQVAGGFICRVVGMYVTEGSAAFDWFEYAPQAPRRP